MPDDLRAIFVSKNKTINVNFIAIDKKEMRNTQQQCSVSTLFYAMLYYLENLPLYKGSFSTPKHYE